MAIFNNTNQTVSVVALKKIFTYVQRIDTSCAGLTRLGYWWASNNNGGDNKSTSHSSFVTSEEICASAVVSLCTAHCYHSKDEPTQTVRVHNLTTNFSFSSPMYILGRPILQCGSISLQMLIHMHSDIIISIGSLVCCGYSRKLINTQLLQDQWTAGKKGTILFEYQPHPNIWNE